jgi:site-specific recombinase XerD
MTNTNATAMDPWITGYLKYLDKVGRKTPRTIIDVRSTLRRATAHFERTRPGLALWQLTLEDFLHWLEAERQSGTTESSLAKYLSHVRGLLEYAWRSGRAERNVLDGFSLQHAVPRTAPKSLDLEEAERLVEATTAPGPAARRDRLIILLLYGCGLRTSELCALDLSRGSIYERVRTWGRRSRVGCPLSPHRLRHTFATHLVRAGVGLVTIRDLLGHRLITSTQIYLHVTADDLRAAAARHPISRLLDTVKHLLVAGPLPFQKPRAVLCSG